MAHDLQDNAASSATSAKSVVISETTPLLSVIETSDQPSAGEPERKWPRSVIHRVLVTSSLMSLSFGVTQVPLIYVFGVMTCDEYYRHHSLPPLDTPAYVDRCRVHSIEADTARAVALLGFGTTFFGVANLFITGWMIKAWGMKRALLITMFWPAIRLLVQNIGVMTGGGLGIMIVELSQVTTIIGGPAGYLLALNSFAAEVVLPVERTATLGRLSGCAMFGTAIGYLAGGLLSDWFGILAPFRVTLMLFCISTLWGALALPEIPVSPEAARKATKNLSTFFDPLKQFVPRVWVLRDGTPRKQYGNLFLGAGAFLAILATGYIPVLLQMYATDIFGFGSSQNSELISLNFIIRAAFLTFVFPHIIHYGRHRLEQRADIRRGRDQVPRKADKNPKADEEVGLPVSPERLATTALPAGEANATEPEEPVRRASTTYIAPTKLTTPDDQQSYEFDLVYTRFSLLLDGILTCLATFLSKGWHMYVVAAILPLAAGTGVGAKGVMLQMCPPEQRTDALSAISLVEMMARLCTTSVFGLIFALFAELGRPNLTFIINGGVAVVGFVALSLARFPPEGAVRRDLKDDDDDHDSPAT